MFDQGRQIMAEHFSGRGRTVHTSNGGAESLFEGLIYLARAKAPDTELTFIADWLQGRLDRCGPGMRSFDLDPPPDELSTGNRLELLAGLVRAYAEELTKEVPDPNMTDISWDRGLRLRWLAMLVEWHSMIAEAYCGNPKIPSLDQANCAVRDRTAVAIYRLLNRDIDLCRQHSDKERLNGVEWILRLMLENELEDFSQADFVRWLDTRAELLERMGDLAGAAATLRAASLLTRDAEYREALEEIATELENRFRNATNQASDP